MKKGPQFRLTLIPLVSSSSKFPISNASAALTSPRGGINGGTNFNRWTCFQSISLKYGCSFTSSALFQDQTVSREKNRDLHLQSAQTSETFVDIPLEQSFEKSAHFIGHRIRKFNRLDVERESVDDPRRALFSFLPLSWSSYQSRVYLLSCAVGMDCVL